MNKEKKLKKSINPTGSFLFDWLQYKNSVRVIIWILVIVCVVLVITDFIYDRYGHFRIEETPGFFAGYGFIMFSLIILGATILRFFVGKTEDYYGDKAIDSEITKHKNVKED